MLRRFLRSFEASPAAMLGAWEPLHLPAAMRHSTLASLQAAVKACCQTAAQAFWEIACIDLCCLGWRIFLLSAG